MWSNWSGNQVDDGRVHRIVGAEDAARLIRDTTGVIRTVGSGHSFWPLIRGAVHLCQIAPRRGSPVLSSDGDRVWIDANATLRDISQALHVDDRAFRNLGDINAQTLAGAISTATHGTGQELPCLSAEVTGLRLIDGTGTLVEVPEADLPGARVALGLLGMISEVQINTRPSYRLRKRASKPAPKDEIISQMPELWRNHRHAECFVLPHSGKGVSITHDITEDAPTKPPLDLDEFGLSYLNGTKGLRHISPALRRAAVRLLMAAMSAEDFVDESWKVLCTTRHTRFNEMEYNLDARVAEDAICEVIEIMETRHPEVIFPIEVRKTAQDSAWLSPFHAGPSVSVAVHVQATRPYEAAFRDCEAVFRAAGGRPHWGKLHTMTRDEVDSLYPNADAFRRLRARFDPEDRFLSPVLQPYFGA
ncbi:D-arabinono-1,4-lactone oxidase [Marimonas lutisalis]|uniref:D-arabinono-1,4-lactone oxidase n=1 Tax=Marimonas lutisalis TaxID=2545756 RepID=UPI0013754941|nr:D-arabinono-1,4-lactone oxidase [Marimonas lutisalis]